MTQHRHPMKAASNTKIITCTHHHVEVLSALHKVCFAEAWSAPAFTKLIDMAGAFGLMISVDDDPVGFIVARQARDEGEIITLGVMPDRRRQGLAGRLVRAAEQQLIQADARSMFLEVADDNPSACALYETLGYREVGRREGYYRSSGRAVDALILKSSLRPESSRPDSTLPRRP